MPEVNIPAEVAELLEPISGNSPAGQDATGSEEYIKLEMETGKAQPDYEAYVKWATEILKNMSKNLRVAIWLCFAWYRTNQMAGFRNGLILILELMKKYGDKLFPENVVHRSKSFAFLNSRISKFMEKDEITAENAADTENVKTLLGEIIAECGKQFPENVPNLKELSQVVEAKAKLVKNFATEAKQESKEELSATPETETVTSAEKVSEDQPAAQPSTEIDAVEEMKVEEKETIQIPDKVAELLEPISADSPAGENVDTGTSEDYFKLEMEVDKPQPDYKSIIEMAASILRDKSKHLRVAIWICYAWYRTEEVVGLRKGMILITQLLNRYKDKLFPEKPVIRGKTLLFLNSKLPRFLEKEEVHSGNAQDWQDIKNLFDRLNTISKEQFSDKAPALKELENVISILSNKAKKLLEKKEAPKAASAETTAKPATAGVATAPSPPVGAPGATVPLISSEKSAIFALKNVLKFFFEAESDGKKERKVPEDGFVYGISRLLQWGKLKLPIEKDKVTQIEGPNPPRQNYIQNLFSNNDWDSLISNIEIDFLTHDGFKYWFDGQRLVVHALEQKGGLYSNAAQEIKIQLDRLIARVPGLPKLIFKDKQTPFASKETLTWLEDEVKGASGGGKAEDLILPPIMGEDYEPINKTYEIAIGELPENFEKNAQAMQRAIEGDTRRKGRFLRMLNLANFCYAARQFESAKVLLTQLIKQIEAYQLMEWEPALCVAVWQSTYLTNIKLLTLEGESNVNSSLEQEQQDLFKKIGNYDLVLALKLSNRKPKQGE